MLKSNVSIDGVPIERLTKRSEKRVVVICNECNVESTTSWSNYTLAQQKFSRNGETYCRRCSSHKSGKARLGKPGKRGPRKAVWGVNHKSWKGGRFVGSDGYAHVHMGGPRNYRREHFIVVEAAMGRPLVKGEIVHHIDGDKLNNTLSNLCVLSSESEHRKVHNNLYQLSTTLVKAGLIKFDVNTKTYMAVDKLRELLEQPEAANQQPSLESNLFEGSTTRNESQVDEVPTSA